MKFKETINDLNGNTRYRFKIKTAIGSSISFLMGAAADLLMASKSGRELRKDIKHKAELCAEKAREAARKTTEVNRKEANSINGPVAAKTNGFKTHFSPQKIDVENLC